MIPSLLALLGAASVTYDLSAFDLTGMRNGWARPGIDRSIENNPLKLGGRVFAKGIGAHAPSQVDFDLNAARSFTATVGVDDEVGARGSVEFLVVVDGKIAWRSGVMRGGQPAKDVRVDLTGAKTLSLRVTDGGDGDQYDHADWAEPRIEAERPPVLSEGYRPMRIETQTMAISFTRDSEGRLVQNTFGPKEGRNSLGALAYPAAGDRNLREAALRIVHADGNVSTDLRVQTFRQVGGLTRITLKDPAYPLTVTLVCRAFPEEDVIETWTEISHRERGDVVIENAASSSFTLPTTLETRLTQFAWGPHWESNMSEAPLARGTTVLDTQNLTKIATERNPFFIVAKDGPLREDAGEVYGGSLAWSGNYRFAFEKTSDDAVRVIAGINPVGSRYRLRPGEGYETPKMVWSYSANGSGELSRKLHRYVRRDVIRDGDRPRHVLLNNWEATYFNFDEAKLASLMKAGKELGFELFLLDDGWFGNKYPRKDDTQGLGDWTETQSKLPRGMEGLTRIATETGIRFGLWFEPEMVNPRSELFEKHPDWVIRQPGRPLHLSRNQAVLDLSNPQVEEYAYQIMHRVLQRAPGISYIKWDCNRFVDQPGSPYLGKDRQYELPIRYVRALYRIMGRLAKEHPNVELMLCASGGGRIDYGAFRYAHEYWASDLTDPAGRIFIQWGQSHFAPVIMSANHVTRWGNRDLKFAFDVAMSGRLGADVDLDHFTADEKAFAKSAIAYYKTIRDVVQLGDQYRLESPYAGPRSGVMYVRGDRAVAFAYATDDAVAAPFRLKGLDPDAIYTVSAQNLKSGQAGLTVTATGRRLMTDGLPLPAMAKFTSHCLELRRG